MKEEYAMKTFLKATSALALIAASAPAFAQEAPPADDEAAPAEIVVTAQKRSERLQDVPVAVSVISGAAIANQGGINIENAQYLVPALNFRKSGASINQSLFLRGVGTSTFSIAGEPSVSTVVDGVVYSRAGEAFSDLVDIERIEVLRGPQGTLFGKNASAGVVNIVTKKPTDAFEGSLEASYFDKSEYRGRAMLNLPISEGTALRVSGFYGKYDGNIFNETLNRKVNGYERYGVRGTLVAEVSPDVTFTVIGDWRKANDDCCAEVIGGVPVNANGTTNTTNLNYIQPGLPTILGDETRRVRQNTLTRSLQTSWGLSFQMDATLGNQTVTSITAYRKFNERELRDGDFLGQAYVDLTSGARYNLQDSRDDGPQTGNTFSQEIRLTSPGKQFFDYVIGAYYSRAESRRTFTRTVTRCDAAVRPATLTPCSAVGAPASSVFSGTADFGSVFKNLAFFGQGTFNLSDAFRVIAGIRYTHDQLDVDHIRVTTPNVGGIPGVNTNYDSGVFNNGLVVGGVFVPGVSNGIPFRNKTTNDNWSGKAGVQYDLNSDIMAYATYARGYKGPAFNTFFNQTTASGAFPIAPETADSYEVGLKNSFMGGRLVLNLAAYYAKYKNFQANNPDVVAGVTTTRFTNAGVISTRGAELDLLWRPVTDLNVSGGVAYTDAKVDQFRLPAGGNAADLVPNGTSLAYAPKWKGSLGVDYRWRTGNAIDFTFNAQGSIQSKQLSLFVGSAAQRAAGTIDSYGLVDLSAGIISSDDKYRLLFQVKNAFDTSFAAAIGNGGVAGTFRYLIPREADRYFGVTGTVKFGSN
jgi:iron complex outermembrane recepter protein